MSNATQTQINLTQYFEAKRDRHAESARRFHHRRRNRPDRRRARSLAIRPRSRFENLPRYLHLPRWHGARYHRARRSLQVVSGWDGGWHGSRDGMRRASQLELSHVNARRQGQHGHGQGIPDTARGGYPRHPMRGARHPDSEWGRSYSGRV